MFVASRPRDQAEFIMEQRPSDALFDLLPPDHLTAVVDIGANPIDGDPPYKGMLAAGLCTVIGFEPFCGIRTRPPPDSPEAIHLPSGLI